MLEGAREFLGALNWQWFSDGERQWIVITNQSSDYPGYGIKRLSLVKIGGVAFAHAEFWDECMDDRYFNLLSIANFTC